MARPQQALEQLVRRLALALASTADDYNHEGWCHGDPRGPPPKDRPLRGRCSVGAPRCGECVRRALVDEVEMEIGCRVRR